MVYTEDTKEWLWVL